MGFQKGQHNFSKGVLTEELWGRSDIVPYGAAVRQGINVLVLKYGGLSKRPGTRYIYEVKDAPARLLPFEGAYGASYAMLMTQASMRLGALGGMVVEQALTVEAVTLGNPTIIKQSYHGYTTGDEVYFEGVLGATWLNGRIFRVTVTDANHFSIPFNSTGLAARTGDTGGIIRSAPPAPPPAPPPVPPPTPTPTPPDTGGDTGSGNTSTGVEGEPAPRCVTVDTPVLMANATRDGPGDVKPYGSARVGEFVWTQHELTLEWGAFEIEALDLFKEPVWKAEGYPRATRTHRFGTGTIDGWVHMHEVGEPAGEDWVVKSLVKGAHTFFTPEGEGIRSGGVLSHNWKPYP